MEKKYTDNNYYGFKKKRTLSQKIHIDFPLLGGLLLALGLSLIVLYSASGQHSRGQPRDLSPNASGGLTPFSPPSELQEIPVATREQSGLLCFHSR